ncbi:sodium-dependent bicarbonate transport family permease [Luteitalea sp. TBR-22]|uniref:sodium-dependent bicarbonate transport family permease n=1 Tax=Luteitalea sp. TBR-22 TaxID=2802971 RepID=UPI001EF6560A|nr:sodium-dependent bicarbonate transport family permease [Luteitalea sp. TBR-22]
MDPVLLFFLFGLAAGLLRSELRLPAAAYDLVSMLLLLSIGLKGGVEIAHQSLAMLAGQACVVIAMAMLLPIIGFQVLRTLGRLGRADAAAIAAHYGSVSVGTYAVAVAYFTRRQVAFEPHMSFLLAIMEVPAIVVGILLARGLARTPALGTLAREVLLGKGIVLLAGGLAIGWASGAEALAPVTPLFFDLFKGFLALFLLEMGLVTSTQIGALRQHGPFLLVFAIAMPLFSSVVGTAVGLALGLSLGGTAMLATLAASASYIAVPAAMRVAVPEANPTLSLAASLGVTFPFNILIGIRLYHALAIKATSLAALARP